MRTRPSAQPTTWRLTLEPAGVDLAWSLLCARPGEPADAVAGGLSHDIHDLAALAETVRPRAESDGRGTRWESDLLDPPRELIAAQVLGRKLLPDVLRGALLDERPHDGSDEPRHEVEIAARGWVATLPWDALLVGEGIRLIELAVVRSAMAPGVIAARARVAPWADAEDAGLAIVDPGPATGPLSSIYAGEVERYPSDFWEAGGLAEVDLLAPGAHPMNRDQFGTLMRQRTWSRLLYLGHVDAPEPDSPADAALVFERAGQPDPLTAARWLADPHGWPAPARVALIACGSDDAAYLEASGLPAAAINAGARLVTTTRWPLLADRRSEGHRGTTALTLAVHHAHRSTTPVRALRRWQLSRLAAWRAEPTLESSPLLWAALSTYSVGGAS